MKKTLLLMCAIAGSTAAWAQSWTQPTLQYSNDGIPEKAALYNVEQKQFLTKGGAWGNHAALGPVENAFVYEFQAQQEEGVYKLYCPKADKQHLLGRESAKDVYTDFNNQAAWGIEWQFEKVEATGNYHMISAHTCPNFGIDKYIDKEDGSILDEELAAISKYQFGWSANEQDLTNGNGEPMGTNVGCYMFDMTLPENEGVSVEWAFVTEDAFAVYNAQSALYAKLNEAFELGYTENELANYAGILTGDDVEALDEATAAVNQLILNYGYNHATPDNPYDVTGVITNPGFDGSKGGTPAGWVCTNAVLQNNKQYEGWDEEAGAITAEKVFNCQIEQWTSSAAIPNAADIHQVLVDLPQGTYKLTGWCIATSSTADRAPEGAELYAQSGSIRYATTVCMPNGAEGSGYPHLTTVEITHFGGDLTIGYSYEPGFVKWWAADNFKLYYCGPVDNPGLLALTSTYAAAQELVENYDGEDIVFTAATYEALKAELESANELMSAAESDACQEEASKLNEMMAGAKVEAAAYDKLNNLLQKLEADVAKYETSVPTLHESLVELLDEYTEAYEDRAATISDIDTWIEGYNEVIMNGIKQAMSSATVDNPIEITALFPNMGFEENTAESTTPNGWTCSASAFKARANTAEVWQASFNCYRVLENLPAGAYKLTANVLSRVGSSVDNYNSYDPDENQQLARLYMNSREVPTIDQAKGASPEQIYTNDANVGTEEEPMWVPNSMEGARKYFDRDDTYQAEVSCVTLNDGDPITIGVKHEGDVPGNSWTIWSDFRVYYMGVNQDALYDEMVGLAEQVSQINQVWTEKASEMINDAVDKADALNPGDEAIADVIAQLKAAAEYNSQSLPLIEKLMALDEEYEGKLNLMESTDEAFIEMLDEVGASISNEEFESNEQISEWLEALPKAWVAYVQHDGLNSASEAEPFDITPVLNNASFDGCSKGNCPGWNFDYAADHIGPNNDTQAGSTACEFWKATSFDMYQEIVGLAEGYYRLTMNGFYRAGNADPNIAAYTENPDSCRDISLYANENAVLLKNILDECSTEKLADEPEYVLNGNTVYAPNTMLQGAAYFDAGKYLNTLEFYVGKDEKVRLGLKLTGKVVDANWCMFDNFVLQYLGTTAPSAVEGVAANGNAAQGAIYDLSGRRVSKAVKGIYIMDGHKVIVK